MIAERRYSPDMRDGAAYTLRGLSVLLLASAVMAGCRTPTVCAAIAHPGITVDVRDSVTNQLAGQGARVIASEGTFADTALFLSGDTPFRLVEERPGTYLVTVEKEGYRTWSRSNVRVTRGTCG